MRPEFSETREYFVSDEQGYGMYFLGISYNCPSLKLYGYSTDLALRRAIRRKLRVKRAWRKRTVELMRTA